MPRSADELVELLDLETLDDNLFRGRQPTVKMRQRVFGGQVAAQALVAGSHTVDPAYEAHSMHCYFLRPGDSEIPILYDVEAIRDGRSFMTRRVVARQHGRPIFYLTANFQRAEEGLDHADPMPDVPGPEEAMRLVDIVGSAGDDARERWEKEWAALDVRYVVPPKDAEGHGARLWIRVDGELPEDRLTQLATFTYASDLTLLGASLVPHGLLIGDPRIQPASLDHAIWFHRPFRPDRWWLYDQASPSASGGRGFATARVFTEDGRLVASVAQEGLIRLTANKPG
ncbi:acyl-CoA thioesterase II [Nocardioides sp. CFH 31398]|uniref:acyl-CoA thioesterase n=1 Tax=Nocardioides sp. CFH 31398 TaxID=2919579 RepID=UPI001F057ED1|nr:acyl-CoA thioesterase II [Nocardioides sp. CFH 31398]MCH1866684.1 acyl-CoA thioesterase II [Nocardioides sp. CFH 31398]